MRERATTLEEEKRAILQVNIDRRSYIDTVYIKGFNEVGYSEYPHSISQLQTDTHVFLLFYKPISTYVNLFNRRLGT